MIIRSGNYCIGLGDEIAATGVIRELKFQYPDEIIHIENRYPEIYYNNPHVNVGKIDSPYFIEIHNQHGNLVYNYAKCLGIKIFNSEPEMFLTNEESVKYIQPYNTVAIDTRAGWLIKKWNHDNFVKLVNLLHDLKFRVIEVGKTLYSSVQKLPNVDDSYLDKLTIRETASVIKSCRLYIGNDSGLSHMSAAVGTKHITIYSKSSLAVNLRYRTTYPLVNINNNCIIEPSNVEHWSKCDQCSNAMNDIKPEDVIHVINQNKL